MARYPLRPRLAALVAACSLLLAAAPAAHAGAWLAPQTFAATSPASPLATLDSQGRLTALWQDKGSGTCNVRAVDHAGGAFSTVRSLSGSVSVPDCQPDLAGDGVGDAVAVWTNGANVFAATRAAAGAWSAATKLETTDGSGYSQPRVAMNAGGRATVVWIHDPGTGGAVRTSRWTPSGGFTAATDAAPAVTGNTLSSLAVGIDSSDNARAIWEDAAAANTCGSLTATACIAVGSRGSASSATWTTGSIQTSSLHTFDGLSVAPDGAGNWLAVWRDKLALEYDLVSAFATGTGAFSVDTSPFSGSGTVQADPPAVAFQPDGSATVVWSQLDTTTSKYAVFVRNRPVGVDSWDPAVAATLVASPDTTAKFVAPRALVVDSAGAVTLLFRQGASVLERDGSGITSLVQPANLGTGSTAVAALSSAGYRAAFWTGSSSTQLRLFDPLPPSAPVLSAPGSGTAGQTLAFNASASDEWGPVAITWDFGDGAAGAPTASGADATHVYGSAGSYTVKATAVDAAGNNSSATTAPVTVTAAPGGGGGGGGGAGGGLPPPTPGVTANTSVLSGDVLVKKPGSAKFVELTGDAQVPIGTIVDARKGSLAITVADPQHRLATGTAYQGRFRLTQPDKQIPATLELWGGSFRGCKKAAHKRSGRAAAAKRKPKFLQQAWAKGKFKTKGKYGAAVVRGTTWFTGDSCQGTLVRVRSGVVVVRDFKRRRNVVVRKGHQYLAHS